ncbi:MAG: glycosyltransferase family 4 protein [Bauldia sp.]
MKIALVYHSLVRGGGKERYVADLARGLAEAGDEVEIYAQRVDPTVAAECRAKTRLVRPLPVPRLLAPLAFAAAIERLRLVDRADRVVSLTNVGGQHLHIGGTHIGYLEALGLRARLKDRVMLANERRTFLRAPRIVTHSRMVAGEIERHYGVPRDRLATIYPPVDTARFRPLTGPERSAARVRYGFEADLRYFLFPSTGHYRKGLDIAAAAFASLGDTPARLAVAGRPPEGPAATHIRYLGYVTEMARLYGAADCTILPTRYEPFGLVIAESLQCGTPVIVPSSAGVAEILDGEEARLLPDLTVETVRAAVLAALDRPARLDGGFGERKGLTVADHVAAIKRLL